MKFTLPILVMSFGVCGYAAVRSQAPPTEATRINFDRDVMPILGQRCFKCHGPDVTKAAAGLRLDSFEGATKKLWDGSAVVPGRPEDSMLIKRVSSENLSVRMPPSDSGVKPLSAQQISLLSTWIKQGAKYEKHWSYVPPTMPPLPVVMSTKWCKNPIDRFVLSKLESNHLHPEPEADRDTLAMRAAQTLTGLPPRREDLEAFRHDLKQGAYERFVDRLLNQQTYGEHEARYWMDAVRYADTHGLQLDNERGLYPYRDWVVRAYNKDLPFDKFVVYQLAGDLLPNPTTEQLIATGYVRANLTSNEGGAIEEEFLARNTFDRVDTTSTVFLGLTVQCAKCHDHKYDPIKQKDYYGLYALFDSTEDKPLDGNILLPPPVVRAATESQAVQLTSMGRELDHLRDSISPSMAVEWLTNNHRVAPATHDWQASPVYSSDSFDAAFDNPKPGEPGHPGAVTWKPIKFEIGKDEANLIGKDNSSIYVKGIVTMKSAQKLTFGVSSDDGVRVWLNGKLIHSNKVARGLNQGIDKVTGDFVAGDNELIAKVVNGSSIDGLNIRLSDDKDKRIEDALRSFQMQPNTPSSLKSLRTAYLELGPRNQVAVRYSAILKEKTDLEASIPMSLIAQELPTPRPTFILKRGLYDQKGGSVQRHIPSALGSFPTGSRRDRLGFANWLTSPSNPLVARVFVNRIWQQHFGTGIVKTSDDFGSQGEWPLNQPLLDYLAVSFQQSGWSIKKLNRLIVTSATFRQSSRVTTAKLSKDPENRLNSRGPRYRLDAEVIRDKALVSGGLLVEHLGGRGFKPYQPDGLWEGASDPASETHFYVRDHDTSIYRRSMYLFWKRTAPPPVMLTFDAPLRDTCTVRRGVTNTPLQALTTMNEPAFLEASRTMAQHLLKLKGDEQRLKVAYDQTLGRPPHLNEVKILQTALKQYRRVYDNDPKAAKALLAVGDAPQAKSASPSEQASWMLICSTLMNTNEFLTLH